jgi:hypothetical protein
VTVLTRSAGGVYISPVDFPGAGVSRRAFLLGLPVVSAAAVVLARQQAPPLRGLAIEEFPREVELQQFVVDSNHVAIRYMNTGRRLLIHKTRGLGPTFVNIRTVTALNA